MVGCWPGAEDECRGLALPGNEVPPHMLTRCKGSFMPPVLDEVGPEQVEVLLSARLVDREEIERRLREHVAGQQDHLPFLCALLVTNSWDAEI